MGQDAETDVASARRRDGLGPDLDLMIDAGLVYDAKTAIQRARLSSPTTRLVRGAPPPRRLRGLRQALRRLRLPIAAGE